MIPKKNVRFVIKPIWFKFWIKYATWLMAWSGFNLVSAIIGHKLDFQKFSKKQKIQTNACFNSLVLCEY